MPRRRKRPRIKRFLSVIAVLAAIPVSIRLMILSIPYMNAAASRAALISAGINLPGGGQANPADAGASSAEDVSSVRPPTVQAANLKLPEKLLRKTHSAPSACRPKLWYLLRRLQRQTAVRFCGRPITAGMPAI